MKRWKESAIRMQSLHAVDHGRRRHRRPLFVFEVIIIHFQMMNDENPPVYLLSTLGHQF